MDVISNISLMTLFPVILLLLTIEIVFASYKSTALKWTTKLAYSNLIMNVAWTIIIIVLLLNPSITAPFFAGVLADIFQRAPKDIMPQVHLILLGIGLAAIASTIIDSFVGFKNTKSEKSKVNETSHE